MKISRNIVIAAIAAVALALFNSVLTAIACGAFDYRYSSFIFSIFVRSVISIPTLLVFCGGIAFELLSRFAKKPKAARVVAACFPALTGLFFAIKGLVNWYGGFLGLFLIFLYLAAYVFVAFLFYRKFAFITSEEAVASMPDAQARKKMLVKVGIAATALIVVVAIAIPVIRSILLNREMEKYRAIVEKAEARHSESVAANAGRAAELDASDKSGLWNGLQFKGMGDMAFIGYYREFTDRIDCGNYSENLTALFDFCEKEQKKAKNFNASDALGIGNSEWGEVRSEFLNRSRSWNMNEALEKMAAAYAEELAKHFPTDMRVSYQMAQVFAGWGAEKVQYKRRTFLNPAKRHLLELERIYSEEELDMLFRLKLYDAIARKLSQKE